MSDWSRFLTDRDREVLAVVGKTGAAGFGRRPAILVVDDTYGSFGFERLPLAESIRRWPATFGLEGWAAVDRTAELVRSARESSVPVVFSRWLAGSPEKRGTIRHRVGRETGTERERANEIVAELAPLPTELVVDKAGPSPFFGTPLVPYLNHLGVDTVLVCGNSTSGCVRAAVVDARSYHYSVGVVADCCVDRIEASHHMSLFDMHQKYADVIGLEAAQRYLATLTGSGDDGVTVTLQRPRPRPVEIDVADAALVIVDMENELLDPRGKAYLPRGAAAARALAPLLGRFRAAGGRVIHIRSVRAPDAPEFTTFGRAPKLLEGSWGVEIVAALAPLPSEPVVEKHGSDPFLDTALDDVLGSLGLARGRSQVIVTGVASSGCVEHAVNGFRLRDYRVYVPIDCTAASSEELELIGFTRYFAVGAGRTEEYNVTPTAAELITLVAPRAGC